MVSVSRIRHTVLRLIDLPRALRARAVTSASACRLNGCWVSANTSQATALTSAWTIGGKNRLAPPSCGIGHGKVPSGPTLPPTPDLTPRKAHPLAGLIMGERRLLVEQQGKLISLDGLMWSGLASDRNVGLPQKVLRKDGTERRCGSRHVARPPNRSGTVSLLAGRLYDIACNLVINFETEHLGRPFAPRDFRPTRESLPHLCAVPRRGEQMSPGAKVLGDGAIRGQKTLGMAGGFEPLHALLPLSRRPMRVLTAVVQIATLTVLHPGQELALGRAVALELIGDNHAGHVPQP